MHFALSSLQKQIFGCMHAFFLIRLCEKIFGCSKTFCIIGYNLSTWPTQVALDIHIRCTIETEVGADPSEASVAAARHLLTEIGRFRPLPPPRLTVALAAAVGYQNKGNPTSLANRHRAIAATAYHALFLNIYGRTLNVTPPRFASSHGYAAALLRRWMRILHKPLLVALEHDL